MDENLVKAPFSGKPVILVPQMPLAEDPRGVASPFERLSQGYRIGTKAFAFEDRVGDPVFEFVSARQKGASRWSAGGTDQVVLKTDRFPMKPIQIGGFEDRMSVGGEIAIPLVIR
jgi:hypothetical protein